LGIVAFVSEILSYSIISFRGAGAGINGLGPRTGAELQPPVREMPVNIIACSIITPVRIKKT